MKCERSVPDVFNEKREVLRISRFFWESRIKRFSSSAEHQIDLDRISVFFLWVGKRSLDKAGWLDDYLN